MPVSEAGLRTVVPVTTIPGINAVASVTVTTSVPLLVALCVDPPLKLRSWVAVARLCESCTCVGLITARMVPKMGAVPDTCPESSRPHATTVPSSFKARL